MEIIDSILGETAWTGLELSIVKRCIHTSADFDYAKNLYFSENSAKIAVDALKRGASIITDTKMAASGINKKKLAQLGGSVYCFMDDSDVAREAKARGVTSQACAWSGVWPFPGKRFFAVGNAPTALIGFMN